MYSSAALRELSSKGPVGAKYLAETENPVGLLIGRVVDSGMAAREGSDLGDGLPKLKEGVLSNRGDGLPNPYLKEGVLSNHGDGEGVLASEAVLSPAHKELRRFVRLPLLAVRCKP